MSELFEQIREQAIQLNKALEKAFNDGFVAGYKKKEEELLEEAKKDEAKLNSENFPF